MFFLKWIRSRRAPQVTLAYARERVARGANYLDEVDPGWYRHVDPETLVLADGSACVLGQLHGGYRRGLGRSSLLNFSSAPFASLSPVDYGFQGVDGVSEDVQARDYELLDAAWSREVRRRQEEDGEAVDKLLRGVTPAEEERQSGPTTWAP